MSWDRMLRMDPIQKEALEHIEETLPPRIRHDHREGKPSRRA
jgi:hypothetical protein